MFYAFIILVPVYLKKTTLIKVVSFSEVYISALKTLKWMAQVLFLHFWFTWPTC